jgi:hydrogenase maturation protein HypF
MPALAPAAGLQIRIRGIVQGVGFRPWVFRTAQALGIRGTVRNDSQGVTVEAFGSPDSLRSFVDLLETAAPPAARVADVTIVELDAAGDPGCFRIEHSRRGSDRQVSIPPDLATCDRCAAEIFDPGDRRHRYPFTNCTDCGPRFTIATDVPYDRPATTMAPFAMCPACRREYEDVGDRRFHAQPNACPVCGPTLVLLAPGGGRVAAADPIESAAEALRLGLVVAVKGIGGFHLACDATNTAAVARLRERKHRDEKPLAVMVRDLEEAGTLALLNEEARRLLTSIERPIVLVPKRPAATPHLQGLRESRSVAPNVAPGNRTIGLFLPYSPLHHLLLADAGVPLIMTSGNRSEEPIAFTNEDALARLGPIADLFLMHDRGIQTRCDDSVVSIIGGRGVLVRRSRGFVPRAIAWRPGFERPVLACGALLKNTFCLAEGGSAWLGPHIGDLENLETFESYEDAIARLERFLDISPAVVACDLHPDYLSTHYARRRRAAALVPVQHHHAHVVSAMVEHGIEEPVIGIAYDGTGYGTDGTMWGGEVLVAGLSSFSRAATFRPIRLVGGDRAIREPWRIALALVLDAFDGAPPAAVWRLFDGLPERAMAAVAALWRRGVQAPLARGVGRYFDGFGALFLRRWRASYEGQAAVEWDQAADSAIARSYPFVVSGGALPELDLRPSTRAAVLEALDGVPASAVAAAFHNTLAKGTATLVRLAVSAHGHLPVVATGGCLQNARLAESIRSALAPDIAVRLHASVPPGDGGLALGQAVIADARARRRLQRESETNRVPEHGSGDPRGEEGWQPCV